MIPEFKRTGGVTRLPVVFVMTWGGCRRARYWRLWVTLVAFYVKSSTIQTPTLLSKDPYFDFGLFHYLPLKNYLFDIFLFILFFFKHILVKSIISYDIIFLIFLFNKSKAKTNI